MGDLSEITYLYLHNNSLDGGIPTELGDLSNLTDLALSSNNLSGSIPTELGDLSSLAELHLGYNSLSGSIPTELGRPFQSHFPEPLQQQSERQHTVGVGRPIQSH